MAVISLSGGDCGERPTPTYQKPIVKASSRVGWRPGAGFGLPIQRWFRQPARRSTQRNVLGRTRAGVVERRCSRSQSEACEEHALCRLGSLCRRGQPRGLVFRNFRRLQSWRDRIGIVRQWKISLTHEPVADDDRDGFISRHVASWWSVSILYEAVETFQECVF